MRSLIFLIILIIMLSIACGMKMRYKSMSRLHSTSTNQQLILDIPVSLRGMRDIINKYDVFLFDQFGVLHDGRDVFPGVLETLQYLKQNNKTLTIVSNTSRRVSTAKSALINNLKVPEIIFDLYLTSGEISYEYLKRYYKSTKCCLFSWFNGNDKLMLDELNITCTAIEHADFILLSGTEVIHHNSYLSTNIDYCRTGRLSSYIQSILYTAYNRKIPIICANSDITAVAYGEVHYMPGGIAEAYEAIGKLVTSALLLYYTTLTLCYAITILFYAITIIGTLLLHYTVLFLYSYFIIYYI